MFMFKTCYFPEFFISMGDFDNVQRKRRSKTLREMNGKEGLSLLQIYSFQNGNKSMCAPYPSIVHRACVIKIFSQMKSLRLSNTLSFKERTHDH